MRHPDPAEMDDGILDHRGESLPYLSKSAKNMKMDKLLSTTMPTFQGDVPGSFIWTKIIYWICHRISRVQFSSIEASGMEKIPRDRGSLCCAWHTNGLLDALQITLNHPQYFVLGARHDLVTRPILGWWTQKMAVQPVVRKAELLRGGCSEDEANFLNGRSLMTLASGIAKGFGCVLFPEGTSHNQSFMLRFRTGPMRTVLAAAAIAAASDEELPVLIPIGLHFRQREYFRTDVWVEYGKPIQIRRQDVPQNLIDAVADGTWSEPPAESVFALRDKLRHDLLPLSPNVATWQEYRALLLLGHIKSRILGNPPKSWKEEVELAREFRDEFTQSIDSANDEDNLAPSSINNKLVSKAKSAAEILHSNGLDGRDLDNSSTKLRTAKVQNLPISAVRIGLFFCLMPIFLLALLPQIVLGRVLGDSTDEGIDARTSYQFLAAMFGSIIIWPVSSAIITALLYWQSGFITELIHVDWTIMLGDNSFSRIISCLLIWLAIFPLTLFTGQLFSLVWDDYVSLRGVYRRLRIPPDDRREVIDLITQIKQEMTESS